MTKVEIALAIICGYLLALTLEGCAVHYPRDQIGLFDQCVAMEAYGLTMMTEAGPYNLGYLKWTRMHETEGCADVH